MTSVNVYDCGRSSSQAVSIYHVIRMLSWQEGVSSLPAWAADGGPGLSWASQAGYQPDRGRSPGREGPGCPPCMVATGHLKA